MDYGALLQLAIAYKGEQEAKAMSEQQLRMFGEQLARIQGIPLPELEKLVPEQLGASAEGALAPDEQLRSKQMQSLAALQNIIDSGGMDVLDKANIEEALNAAYSQQKRAREGVAADAAARGQMNGGARLLMNMDAAQKNANAARSSGMEVAGQAQRRRMQAIIDSANMAAALRNEDWAQKDAAAKARDIREERNANAREAANRYNAGLAQQNFQNHMARETGSQPAANSLGGAYNTAGSNALGAANTMQVAAGQIGRTPTGGGGGGNGDPYTYDYNPDETGNRGGAADLSKDDPDK